VWFFQPFFPRKLQFLLLENFPPFYQLADCIRIAGQNGDAQVVDVTGHFWVDVDTKDDFHRAKRLIVKNSQKKRGASDFVAHYFNRPIENAILYISEWRFITLTD